MKVFADKAVEAAGALSGTLEFMLRNRDSHGNIPAWVIDISLATLRNVTQTIGTDVLGDSFEEAISE